MALRVLIVVGSIGLRKSRDATGPLWCTALRLEGRDLIVLNRCLLGALLRALVIVW